MNSLDNRKKLHTYIADLDDKKILAMLTLLEDEVTYQTRPALTEKDKKEILRREENRVTGKSKTYTISQSKKLIRRKPK